METCKIIIPLERFKDLIRAETQLICLEHNGVENWEWYGESMDGFEKHERDPEKSPARGYYNIIDAVMKEQIEMYEKIG